LGVDDGKAWKQLEEAQDLTLQVYWPDHPSTSKNLSVFAGVHRRAGRLHEALQYSEKALRITEAYYGTEHPEVGINLDSLAQIRADQGQWGEAVRLHRRDIKIIRRFMPESPALAGSLFRVGRIFAEHLSDPDEAHTCFREVRTIQESIQKSYNKLGIPNEWVERILQA